MEITSPGETFTTTRHTPTSPQTTTHASPPSIPEQPESPSQMPPITQGHFVKNAMLKRLELGARYFLIPTKWYVTFDHWSRGLGGEPGKVDPASLLDGDGVVREDFREERDFHIIDQTAWDMIVQK